MFFCFYIGLGRFLMISSTSLRLKLRILEMEEISRDLVSLRW